MKSVARHVDGLAPLLVALVAYALAAMAMRSCSVDEPEWPLFVEVGMDQETCEVCGRRDERVKMPVFHAAGDDTKRYCCATDERGCLTTARRWIAEGMPVEERRAAA